MVVEEGHRRRSGGLLDTELGGRRGERRSLVVRVTLGGPQLVGPDEDVLEALGLVAGEVGLIRVRHAHVDRELAVRAGGSRSSTTRSRSRTASSNDGVPELNQPSPAVAARRRARSLLPPRISGTSTGSGESCTLPNENSGPSCENDVAAPRPPQDRQRLVHAGGAVVERHAERVELLLQPAGADAEQEPTAGDVLQGERHAGREQRVTQGQDEDPGRQSQAGW